VVFVLGLFAVGCLVAALRWAEDGIDRAFYWGCFALNAVAALAMIGGGYQFAWRLQPAAPLNFLGF
jgi:hypothetical protein